MTETETHAVVGGVSFRRRRCAAKSCNLATELSAGHAAAAPLAEYSHRVACIGPDRPVYRKLVGCETAVDTTERLARRQANRC